MTRRKDVLPISLILLAGLAWAQNGDLATVATNPISQTVELPAELLIVLTAPEMDAQIAEADSKVQSAEADRIQAEAQLAAAQSTYERTQEAAKTPGAIAGNDLVLAQKQVDAAQALVNSKQKARAVAESAVNGLKAMQMYLKITAPFDGVVTDRLVHPGALVDPPSDPSLLVIQQVSRLRVVVPVPYSSPLLSLTPGPDSARRMGRGVCSFDRAARYGF